MLLVFMSSALVKAIPLVLQVHFSIQFKYTIAVWVCSFFPFPFAPVCAYLKSFSSCCIREQPCSCTEMKFSISSPFINTILWLARPFVSQILMTRIVKNPSISFSELQIPHGCN